MAKVWVVFDANYNLTWISEQKPALSWSMSAYEVDINASRLKYIRQIVEKYQGVQEFLIKVHDDAEKHPGKVRRYGGSRG